MKEQDYDPEFDGMPMWDQLGKIVDSIGNPVMRDWVKTDDDVVFDGISPEEAQEIKYTLLEVKPLDRLEVFRKIQESIGFKEMLEYVRSK